MLFALFSLAVVTASIGDVGFDSDDRLDALGVTGVMKLDRTVHVAVVGQRQRLHSLVFRHRYQCRNGADPIEQAVMAVHMKMAILIGNLCQDSSGC